jgi:CheY-like chemotaxis protein
VHPCSGSLILVVDDESVIASSLAAMLRMNGFSARFFTCPLEALAAARSESPDPTNLERLRACRTVKPSLLGGGGVSAVSSGTMIDHTEQQSGDI